MNTARRKQGQFIIIAALMVAIIMISAAAVMYSTLTQFRHERAGEYVSVVDSIRASTQRLMEICLANYTKNYYEEGGKERETIDNYTRSTLNRWEEDLRETYAGLGLDVNFTRGRKLLAPAKTIGDCPIPERWINLTYVKCYWYYPEAISSFYAGLKLNASKLGLHGYETSVLIYLNASLDIGYIYQEPPLSDIDHLNITVTRENQMPVPGLTTDNFLVYKFSPEANDWEAASLSGAEHQGAGRYRLTFQEPIEAPYYKWLIIRVIDNRGIVTVASTYWKIEFIVEKNTPTTEEERLGTSDVFNGETPDEIYTLEVDVSGRWYWNGVQLNTTGELALPPIPHLPIKQFRVNVTENGIYDTPRVSPCQYEVWDTVTWHGQLLQVPRDLADPYHSFDRTNRIVFQVKFPNLTITQQKVVMWWIDDMDTEPYQGPSDLQYIEGTYVARTNIYEVEFIGVGHTQSPDYPYDYYGVAALIMKKPVDGSSFCFGPWNIHAFGKYGGSLAEWRPYGQWQIKYWYGGTGAKATVRLIALLNTTRVQCVYNPYDDPPENYYDTYAIVFVTANVKYLQQSVYIYWKQSHSDYGIWFATVMGKGEPKWFAYLNNQTGQPYSDEYDWEYPTHEEYSYPGHWGAHWNETVGRGLILNVEGLKCLKSLDASRTRFSITEAAPGGAKQGSIEFEAINCAESKYTIAADTSYSYIWAMWMYNGGDEDDGYYDVEYYYWMFLEPYAPRIIFTEGGG